MLVSFSHYRPCLERYRFTQFRGQCCTIHQGGWVAILYTASLSELSRKRVFCSNYLCTVISYPRARYTVAKRHQGHIIVTLVCRYDFGGCEEERVNCSIIPSQKGSLLYYSGRQFVIYVWFWERSITLARWFTYFFLFLWCSRCISKFCITPPILF